MENGSKALIIAGAILLAILIIGLGVFIYNQASNTVSDTGMDQVAIRQFNGKFEQYINRELGAVQAKALIDTVQESNRTSGISIRLPQISDKSQIVTGHKYNVEAYEPDGVIREIIISDLNGQASSGNDGGIDDGTIVVEDIRPQSFNQQFSQYVDRISSFQEDHRAPQLSWVEVKTLEEKIYHSNSIYDNHQISYINNAGSDDYDFYTATAEFDRDDYIYSITTNGYIEAIK